MSFEKVFELLTGHTPMRWQERLFGQLREGRLPDALDVPTGLGKTSVMTLWLIARAAGAPLPRRLAYIVDRRAVVDQATEEAAKLAATLGDGRNSDDLVRGLREGLGLPPGRSLPVSTLRGQYADNRAWLEMPTSSAIVVGTVDMIGSRLLFGGYGVSARMRPVHAGLLGCDALAVLDEAHLVPPFEALLRQVAAWPRPHSLPAFHVLTLSATGRTDSEDVFRLDAADEADPRASKRLLAQKRLMVHSASGDLAPSLAAHAIQLSQGQRRVLVYCDSRKVAQETAGLLKKQARERFGAEVHPPALLVGARRVREREALKQDPTFCRFMPAKAEGAPADHAAFLIATSAGEVGVDLDADDMVCDLVAWERMVQRLGRVNRRAEPGVAMVDVLVTPAEPEEAELEVARKRAPFDSPRWDPGKDQRRDASPKALAALRKDPGFASLLHSATTPEPLRPALSAAHVAAWAMTSLEEHPGRPEIEPWLRGWVQDDPQVRLVWRRHLPLRAREGGESREDLRELAAFLLAAAPHLTETLEVPAYQAVEVMKKRAAAWIKAAPPGACAPMAAVLDSRGKLERLLPAADLKAWKSDTLVSVIAGRTLVIEAALGGLDVDGLLDDKAADPPPTLDGDPEEWGLALLDAAGFRVRLARRSEHDRSWPVAHRWPLDPEDDSEEAEELRVEVWRESAATSGDPAIARVPQALGEHLARTADEASRIAQGLGLEAELSRALVVGAALHDAGKARALWQTAMGAPRDGRPYAKTAGGGTPRALEIDGQTYRHEFGSLQDAEADDRLRALPDPLRELALHLVGAHHGFGRPLIAPVDPSSPPSAAAERARAVALRFVQLQKEWGPWGLAYLETLLRSADWAASRELNEKGRAG